MADYTPKYDLNSVTRLLSAVRGLQFTPDDLIEDRATIDAAVDDALSFQNLRVRRAIALVYGLPAAEPMTYAAAGKVFYRGSLENMMRSTQKITLNKEDPLLKNIAEQYGLEPEYLTGGELTIKMSVPKNVVITGAAVASHVHKGLRMLRHPSRGKLLRKIVNERS